LTIPSRLLYPPTFCSRKQCSSGAGKTTLMDVLALRKSSGKITGDVRVNGHTQEANSFRRMSGYVEQFDVQSPQLTVRETVEFSTKMRLEESIPIETKLKFSEQILDMLELNSIGHLLVGNLSFEQRKR
jgi:ABC-type multidrug transport system ATPase subunit